MVPLLVNFREGHVRQGGKVDNYGRARCDDVQFTIGPTYEARLEPNVEVTDLWLLSWNKLMTNAERLKRHFTSDGDCPCCVGSLEDIDHIFWKCTIILPIWVLLIKEDKLEEFMSMEIKNWIRVNLTNNNAVILERSKRLQMLTHRALEQDYEANRRQRRERVGAIRNNIVEWLVGFKKFLGVCSSLEAELWGIYVGFLRAWNTGVRRVVVENDNLNVINMMNDHKRKRSSTIVDHILCLLERE
ncbi:uncharacterized protein LOC120192305 [Hibiscus syriacus]|uniref:uncharacterized protein LOC120192305 n=1 Tax=Hibiscus syriacus TaxID=106335 RepID=UPI001922B0BB|nr:uncharacterized protein LOC120192305 [Hibiscus syriacus]